MAEKEVQYVLTLKDLMSGNLKTADSNAEMLDGTMHKLESTLAAAGVAFGMYELKEFADDVIETGSKIETLNNVINYTSKSADDAAENHAFLRRMIEDYKLPIIETTEGFSAFNAALMGSELAGEKARKIYEGVSIGVTAMHLSAQQGEQVFMALNQMVSKGTVASQELKLQLGNALPGAFQIAARAMHMTTAEFTKQLESGSVLAKDFLPAFAAEMQKQFGGAIPNAVESTIAKQTDYKNSLIDLKNEIFEGAEPAIKDMYDDLKGMNQVLIDGVHWLKEHKDVIKGVEGALITATTAMATYLFYLGAIKVATMANTVQTFIAMAATDGLAAAMYAAGITGATAWAMATGGLSVLVGAVVYAYYHFDKFRAVINGVWEAAKTFLADVTKGFAQLAIVIADMFVAPWRIGEDIRKLKDIALNAGSDIADAYHMGYTKTMQEKMEQSMDKQGPAGQYSDRYALIWAPGGGKTAQAPGGAPTTETPTTPTSNSPSNAKGTNAVTINIHINNLIGKFTVNTTHIAESYDKITTHVANALLAAANDASLVADV